MASLLLPILYIVKGYLRAVVLYKIIYRRRRGAAQKIRGLEIIEKVWRGIKFEIYTNI